jgi:hypothetical protein
VENRQLKRQLESAGLVPEGTSTVDRGSVDTSQPMKAWNWADTNVPSTIPGVVEETGSLVGIDKRLMLPLGEPVAPSLKLAPLMPMEEESPRAPKKLTAAEIKEAEAKLYEELQKSSPRNSSNPSKSPRTSSNPPNVSLLPPSTACGVPAAKVYLDTDPLNRPSNSNTSSLGTQSIPDTNFRSSRNSLRPSAQFAMRQASKCDLGDSEALGEHATEGTNCEKNKHDGLYDENVKAFYKPELEPHKAGNLDK